METSRGLVDCPLPFIAGRLIAVSNARCEAACFRFAVGVLRNRATPVYTRAEDFNARRCLFTFFKYFYIQLSTFNGKLHFLKFVHTFHTKVFQLSYLTNDELASKSDCGAYSGKIVSDTGRR